MEKNIVMDYYYNPSTSNVEFLSSLLLQRKTIDELDFYKKILSDRFEDSFFFFSSDSFDVLSKTDTQMKIILNLEKINHFPRINKFFEAINDKLEFDGLFLCSVQTYANRRFSIERKYIYGLRHLLFVMDTIFHRILPKLRFTRKLYFYLTGGRTRLLSRAETYGRLYSCGFEVIHEKEINNELYFVAKKIGLPSFDMDPTYGPLIKLKRVGKNGKVFKVYKLRTMYPYSEYLQDYVFTHHQLDEGGKFKNDFRISPLGRILRKFWLDEIPMIWNLLNGDMKLVGVRPLSKQYFNLYSKTLQEKRIRTKPGLLPPFYADLPKTLEEIMASEERYLDAHEKSPLWTDVRYFFLIIKNIVFRGARSK